MKIALLTTCLAVLAFLGVNSYPVIRFGLTSIAPDVTISMAYRICGLNARCLLQQNVIGMEYEDVRHEYSALLQLAVLRELSGLVGTGNAGGSVEKESSSEEVPVSGVPSVGVPDVVDVPAHEDEPESEEATAGATHRVQVIAIRRPFGTRRVILINPVVRGGDSDESGPSAFPDPATSDASSNVPTTTEPKDSDESGKEGVSSWDISSTSKSPRVEAETSTELTNAIEQNSRGSAKPVSSEEDRREPLDDESVDLPTDQVEVFDPVKPMKMVSEDRFKYEAATPEIREI